MSKKTLLPVNSTAHQRAMEQAAARISEVPVPIRQLWSPDECPEELLPWLAWALSMDSWSDSWPESVKRQRVRQAVDIARRKGTVRSIREMVSSFGGDLSMLEWFQQDPIGVPHTVAFTLTIGEGVPRTAAYQQDIVDDLNRIKPRRTRFSLTAGLQASGGLGMQAITRPVIARRIIAEEL